MSWWGTEGVGSWLPFSADLGFFGRFFFLQKWGCGSFCHRRSIFQNSSSYLCPARCSVVIIIHNLGLPAVFAMSLCHCITSNETQSVLYSWIVQTNLSEFLHFLPKSGGYTQLPMFLSPLGTFPGSVALWGVKLLWSKPISKTFCSSSRSMLFKVITAIKNTLPQYTSETFCKCGWSTHNRF